ncbi:MAG: DUF4915 domain-containing protein [Hyphomicrobium sp.]
MSDNESTFAAQPARQAEEVQPATPAADPQPVAISCTRGLADWLLRHQVSLAFTSYQSGRLCLVGVDEHKRVSFQERFLARAMGLWADSQRLVVATIFQVWRFENVLPPGESASGGADRHYVPRVAHTTGDLDIHDIAVMADGRIVFVNTLYSCLATLSVTHSFRPYWKPRGVQIVNLASDDIVEWIKLEGGVSELFDVAVIPGVRQPTATGFLNDEVHKLITIEA